MFRAFLLFLPAIFFLSSCFLDPYTDHYTDEVNRESFRIPEDVYSGSFASGSFTIWRLPDPEKLRELTHMIDQAKQRVWIEVYILTEKSVIASLIEARKRGVDVRIILERNVYGSPFMHEDLFRELTNADIPIQWANNNFFTFTHAKFFLIDGTCIISTGNLSYSTFTKNREFLVLGTDISLVQLLEHVFLADHDRKFIAPRSPFFIFSPTDSRVRIMRFLESARSTIAFSLQSLSDPEIIALLGDIARRNIEISLCLADTGDDEGKTMLRKSLSGSRIHIGYSKKPYVHAKAGVVDGKYLFIGSMNFTSNALDHNREVGILFESSSGSSLVRESIQSDCGF